MPYWRYIKSYISGDDDPLQSRSDMRWAAFSGLVYGYTGHTWFVYKVPDAENSEVPSTLFSLAGGWNAQPTERFAWAAEINRELRTQYLIAFTSTSEKPLDELRKIKVEVDRKGVKVRTITGYFPAGGR